MIKDAVLQQDSELLLDELRAAEVDKTETSSCNFGNNKIEVDSDFQGNINFVWSKSYSRLPDLFFLLIQLQIAHHQLQIIMKVI